MNKNALIGVIIGLLAGVTGTISATALINKSDTIGLTTNTSSMSMSEMNTDLRGRTGDDFDKAFTSMMIEHHQGAIDMANLAAVNAKHDEIKELSKAIVTAQTNEIAQMQQWQMDWGYMDATDSMPGMMH